MVAAVVVVLCEVECFAVTLSPLLLVFVAPELCAFTLPLEEAVDEEVPVLMATVMPQALTDEFEALVPVVCVVAVDEPFEEDDCNVSSENFVLYEIRTTRGNE